MHIPTLKIKHGEDYTLINVDDFDPSVHERFEDAEPQVAELPTVQQPELSATQSDTPTIQQPELPTTQTTPFRRSLKAKK